MQLDIHIDPPDYHLLGLSHHNNIYFDIVPSFGMRSVTMMCQRTTLAVTHMFQSMGNHCTNYIDNFGGANLAENAQFAFQALGDLFATLGLEWSADKDCEPSQSMIFLDILFNSPFPSSCTIGDWRRNTAQERGFVHSNPTWTLLLKAVLPVPKLF